MRFLTASTLAALVLAATPLAAQERKSLEDDLKYYADQAAARVEALKKDRERYAPYANNPNDPFAKKYAALTRQIEEAEKSEKKHREFVGVDTSTMAVIKETAKATHDDLVEMNRMLMDNWALWIEDALTANWTNLVKTGYDTMFRQKVRKQIREKLGVADTVEPLEAYLMDLALGVETKDNATIATEWLCKKVGIEPADLKKSPQAIFDKVALAQINLDQGTIEALAEFTVDPTLVDVDWDKAKEMACEKLTAKGLDKLRETYGNQVKKQFESRMQKELGSLSYVTDDIAERLRDSALSKLDDAMDSASFVGEIAQKIYEWSQADFGPVFDGVKLAKERLQKSTGKPATWEEAFVAWQAGTKGSGSSSSRKNTAQEEPLDWKARLMTATVAQTSLADGRVSLVLHTTWRSIRVPMENGHCRLKLLRDGKVIAESIPMHGWVADRKIKAPHTMMIHPVTKKPAPEEYEITTSYTAADTLDEFQLEPTPLQSWDYEFVWETVNSQGAIERLAQAHATPRFAIQLTSGRNKIALVEGDLPTETRPDKPDSTIADAWKKAGDAGTDGAITDQDVAAEEGDETVAPIAWTPPSNVIIQKGQPGADGTVNETLLLRTPAGDKSIGMRWFSADGKLVGQSISIEGRRQGWFCPRPNGPEFAWYHEGVQHGPYVKSVGTGRETGCYRNGKLHGRIQQFAADGHAMTEKRYRDGVPIGQHTIWDYESDAHPHVILNYDDAGKLVPPQLIYDTKSGELLAEYAFDERVAPAPGAQSVQTRYYKRFPATGSFNGTNREQVIRMQQNVGSTEVPYRAGLVHGTRVIINKENRGGTSREEAAFVDGQRHGLTRLRIGDVITSETEHDHDKQIARRNFHPSSGKLVLEEYTSPDGQPRGTWRYFEPGTDSIRKQIEYDEGHQVLRLSEYDGREITLFKDGKPLRYTKVNPSGSLRETREYAPDGSSRVTWYHDNGNVSATWETDATNHIQGIRRDYKPDGTLKSETNYKDGKKVP